MCWSLTEDIHTGAMEALDNFDKQLDALAEKMASLPEQLNQASRYLERGRLRRIFSNLECWYKALVANEEEARKSYSFAKELGYTLLSPKAGERVSRLKEPVDVRIVVGKGVVTALAISRLAREGRVTTHSVVHSLRQEGYTVLTWNQYRRLLSQILDLAPPHLLGTPVAVTTSTSRLLLNTP